MPANRPVAIVLGLGAATLVALPLIAQQRQPTSGPVARYDMRAGTISGFGAMGAGMGGALSMAFGGGGAKVQKELYLRLGSSQPPAKGAPKAEHFMPAGAKLGKSVQLATPREERGMDELPQKPKGRILLFWGCGEHAPKGQPVVIDLARLGAGEAPPGLWTSSVIRDWGPDLQNSRTFGRWPAEDHKFVKADSSLPGAHRVAGNYSPEIAFTLSRDFMAPLSSSATEQASGASLLRWTGVADATGYLATLFAGKTAPNGEMADMVMWTSSASRQFGGGLGDWLSPGQVAALVRERTVMAPTTTQCVIPAEVRKAGPDFRMGTLTAFGPEENFAYPERPADLKVPWNLQWTARIRHRSTTTWMDMPGMEQMGAQQTTEGQAQPPKCKKKGGLGGVLGGVLGGKDC